jgi:hypothetical protein
MTQPNTAGSSLLALVASNSSVQDYLIIRWPLGKFILAFLGLYISFLDMTSPDIAVICSYILY